MAKNKIKVPKSVLDLKMSPKKYAKKNHIKIKGSKKEKKRGEKRLCNEYSEFAISGLNKAVKILAENDPTNKKVIKVRTGVDNVISNPEIMKQISKLYQKNPEAYPNMIYLPHMIMNTIMYYQREDISDEEKEIGKSLDTDGLIAFCEKILKKEIKKYKKLGLSEEMAYIMATTVPTTKIFKKDNRQWYKELIVQLYSMAETETVDVDQILKAVTKLDKNGISRKEFLEGFFTEFILKKSSNKNLSFTDTQKDLHEDLVERCLVYLDGLKSRKLREIMKQYIKRRKTAESYKNDGKRVIKFIDYANSNSSYTNLKKVIEDLIADDSSNELYLS